MKISIQGWVYFNPLAVVGDMKESAYFFLAGERQSKTESRHPVRRHSIDVDLGTFDPRPGVIEAVTRKRERIAAQFEKEMAMLDGWIRNMLALDEAHPG